MITVLDAAVDTTILLAAALAVTALLARRSAALRHSILAAAIVAALAAPAITLALPRWAVMHWTAAAPMASDGATFASAAALDATVTMPVTADTEVPFDLIVLIGTAWALGAAVLLTALLLGFLRLRRLIARCVVVRSGPWRDIADSLANAGDVRRQVVILQSDDASLLVTCGVLRPKIVLPAGAESWPRERIRIVLAHELAHVRRHDGALQIAGELLRVAHWLNPLVWLVCRRLRQESEYACDDVVLNGGVDASDYASQLLAVARHASGRSPAWVAAPGIAHPSTLERRIDAMLIHRRNRNPLTRRTSVATALAAAAVIVPLAAASIAPASPAKLVTASAAGDIALPSTISTASVATEAPVRAATRVTSEKRQLVPARAIAPAAVASAASSDVPAAPQPTAAAGDGTILIIAVDQTGAVLPGVSAAISSIDQTLERESVTDSNGRVMFNNLPPAQYGVALSLPGFGTVKTVQLVTSGQVTKPTLMMPIGSFNEFFTIGCGTGPVAQMTSPRASTRSPVQGTDATPSALSHWARGLIQALVPTLSAQQLAPVRVGGNIQAPRKIFDVWPACPSTPPTDSLMILSASLGSDGAVRDVKSLRNALPQEFLQAAIDAIQRWKFTPALLNGMPVAVNMSVTISYRQ